jgi:hypothetical protein
MLSYVLYLVFSQYAPLRHTWYSPSCLYIKQSFSLFQLIFTMPQRTKRQAHATTVSSAFLTNKNPSDIYDNNSSEEDDSDQDEPDTFKDRITDEDMSDLFEICKSKCPVKYLTVLLYMTLRKFGINWRNCDAFLRDIGE